ncbi:hypothetical protein PHYPSEUDO_000387 [Phytophthora pseudosyringae]|uniref:Uncharacterized protein n=1 Tax=Phytophthora pseudosyringae TaxID=221518 RepID=A0A8T1VY02_9STRA|nr:hypothetical protein PHYPSEUDO_000387 [Phytophthora pseudosyringae]
MQGDAYRPDRVLRRGRRLPIGRLWQYMLHLGSRFLGNPPPYPGTYSDYRALGLLLRQRFGLARLQNCSSPASFSWASGTTEEDGDAGSSGAHNEEPTFNMALSDHEDGVSVIKELMYIWLNDRNMDISTQNRKILIVAEAASLVVIAGQMYMARWSREHRRRSWRNGMLCETAKSSLNLLHEIFRTTLKKEILPQPH